MDMLFFKLIIFCITLLFSSAHGMECNLPSDIIREVAKVVVKTQNWTDSERVFGLQAFASINKHWLQAMTGLMKSRDLPY